MNNRQRTTDQPSNIQNDLGEPPVILAPQAQPVAGRRFHLVVQHMSRAVDRLAADRRFQATARSSISETSKRV